jgi:hypothetical protein
MKQTISIVLMVMALSACGKSSDPGKLSDDPSGDASAGVPAKTSAAGDPCTLIDDPDSLFGQPVGPGVAKTSNNVTSCQWNSAEGRLCGMVTPFGSRWNEVPDLNANYSAMVRSLGAFGQTHPVAGIGEDAVAVDGGMLGAQMAIRTSNAIANIGAACGGSAPANLALVEKVARSVAAKL